MIVPVPSTLSSTHGLITPSNNAYVIIHEVDSRSAYVVSSGVRQHLSKETLDNEEDI